MPLSNQLNVEGDGRFIGWNSRIAPTAIQPGYVQASKNMRMETGTAKVRLGAKRVSDATMDAYITLGSCVFVDPTGVEKLVICTRNAANQGFLFIYTPETATSAATTFGPITILPTNRKFTSQVEMVQAGGKVYIFRGRASTSIAYIDTITHATGPNLITVTTFDPHGFSTGDEVTVYGTGGNNWSNNFVVTVTSSTTFTYTPYSTPTGSASGGSAVLAKPPFVWDGVTFDSSGIDWVDQDSISGGSADTPPGDTGIYHQGRLIVDFKRDQIALSDIFDTTVFDLTLNNFRVNTGDNDRIVAFLPWIDNQFLVLQTRGIYLCYVEDSSYAIGAPPGTNSFTRLLSGQIGCVARNTAVLAGQQVFFLSEKGIHIMTPRLDLTLTGEVLPLSEAIDPDIMSINQKYVSVACACYFDNRYWLAAPTGDNQRNNKLFVYNMLNSAWETADEFPAGFYVDFMRVMTFGSSRRLYIGTREGGIFVHEEQSSGDSVYSNLAAPVLPFTLPSALVPAGVTTQAVTGEITTRSYFFNSLEAKRYSKVNINTNGSGSMTVQANMEDPDSTSIVGSLPLVAGDSVKRLRVASKSRAIDFTLTLTGGSPEVRSIAVVGVANSFQTVSTD